MKLQTASIPLLALAGSAAAQSFTSGSQITFALHWQDTGNHNGLIEPGEGALLGLDVSFTNQNAVATFSPSFGTFGSGTIRSFGAGFIDLIGSATGGGNAQGTWNVEQSQGFGVSGIWDMTGGLGNGMPEAMGEILRCIQFGQFNPQGFPIFNANPIQDIWRGVWTPADYSPRTVTMASEPAIPLTTAALVLWLSSSIPGISVFVVPENLIFGSVQIPIVPAPPSLALVASALVLRRRRLEVNG